MIEKKTLARPYAKAIFELAVKEQTLEPWSQQLELLCRIVENHRVGKLLINPEIGASDLADFFIDVAGSLLTAQGKNLVKLLARYHRLILLSEITALYEHYKLEAERILPVDCVTAVPLTETEKQHFVDVLNKKLERKIQLSCKVNKDLLGGFLLKANDVILDGSVRGQLLRLKEKMEG